MDDEMKNYPAPGGLPHSPSSFLDRMIENAPLKRLQYLRGKEGALTSMIQWVIVALGGLWIFTHLNLVNQFFDQLISSMLKAAVIAAMLITAYLGHRVLDSKPVRDAINYRIDRFITATARWLRSRGDKFKEAEFNIDLVRKYQVQLQDALSRLIGALKTVKQSVDMAISKVQESGRNARALQQELERRHAGGHSQPASIQFAQMSDGQLQDMFVRAKSSLHAFYNFYQEQMERQARLGQKCSMIQEVGRMTTLQIEDMVSRLKLASTNYENALAELRAMGAAEDVVDSEATRAFEEQVAGINHDIDLFGGRVQVIMDRLDPAMQNYRANQIGSDVADEEFYRAWLAQTNLRVDPNVERQILTPVQKPVLADVESILGNPPQRPKPGSASPGAGIDELLQ